MVQFIIMSQNGDHMTPLLKMLRTSDISVILEKYAAMTVNATWFTCFIPPPILEVACRCERGQTLDIFAKHEFDKFEKRINSDCPKVKRATERFISYAKLRELPITIFGGSYAGATINECGIPQRLSAGDLLKKYMNYTNVESVP